MTTIQHCLNQTAETVLHMGVAGAVGSLVARIFTSINPLSAFIYSSSYILVKKCVEPIFKDIFSCQGANEAIRIVGSALGIAASIAISAGITTVVAATPFSFASGALLSITTVALSIILTKGMEFCFAVNRA